MSETTTNRPKITHPITIEITQEDIDGAQKRHPSRCPIARALIRTYGKEISPYVNADGLVYCDAEEYQHDCPVTDAAVCFMDDFDADDCEGRTVKPQTLTITYADTDAATV